MKYFNESELLYTIDKLPSIKKSEEVNIWKVRIDPEALRHIDNQTEEICLSAIKAFQLNAFQYVNNKTEKICIEALNCGISIRSIPQKTEKICIMAIIKNLNDLYCIYNVSPYVCFIAYTYHGKKALKYIPDSIKNNIEFKNMIEKIPSLKHMCLVFIKKNNIRMNDYVKDVVKMIDDLMIIT
jgi:hypothetical protein